MASIFQRICSEVAWCRQDVLEATLDLAIEIGREGREGRRVAVWNALSSPVDARHHMRSAPFKKIFVDQQFRKTGSLVLFLLERRLETLRAITL